MNPFSPLRAALPKNQAWTGTVKTKFINRESADNPKSLCYFVDITTSDGKLKRMEVNSEVYHKVQEGQNVVKSAGTKRPEIAIS